MIVFRIASAVENFTRWRQQRPDLHEVEDAADAVCLPLPRGPGAHCDGFEISRRVMPPTTLGRGVTNKESLLEG